jgi:hypothetical protein
VVEFVYKRRQGLRLLGLALLAAGIGVAIGISALAGWILVGAAALVLASVQPLLLAHIRYRQAHRRAPQNGHGADPEDLEPPL